MKIRSQIRAGRTFEECAKERDWWKMQAGMMEDFAKSNQKYPPAGLWFPGTATQLPSTPPSQPSTGTGAFYPDLSGVCG